MLPVPKNDRDTYIQIRDMARKFADEAVRPKAEALDRDERFPQEL
jgi:alkylation response protein AidB-like acyl-CoA dehydrogenase